MKLLLIRHGEIPSNVNKVYAGRSPEELTPAGIGQAETVAEKCRQYNINTIYSSPIRRALQTAEIISEKNSAHVIVDSSFREMEMGPWEGMSEKDIPGLYPEEWDTWHSRPAELRLSGRETLDVLQHRVLDGIRSICDKAGNMTIAVVTHVAIIRVLLLWHSKQGLNLYKTIHVPNAEIFEMNIEDCSSL